jgi:hypothetical protein
MVGGFRSPSVERETADGVRPSEGECAAGDLSGEQPRRPNNCNL